MPNMNERVEEVNPTDLCVSFEMETQISFDTRCHILNNDFSFSLCGIPSNEICSINKHDHYGDIINGKCSGCNRIKCKRCLEVWYATHPNWRR